MGVAQMHILPHIEPEYAFLLVLFALAPAAVSLYKRPQPQRFATAIAYACLCAFWFGYHVHEKAIITVRACMLAWTLASLLACTPAGRSGARCADQPETPAMPWLSCFCTQLFPDCHTSWWLQAIIPLAIPAVTSATAAEDFVVLSCAGHYGLLPLLFTVSMARACMQAGSRC